MIELKDVHKSFGKLEVLKGINLTVNKGDVVSVIGPSGSGKSTMLRCINRLESINKGTILIDGEDITHSARKAQMLRRNLGMVFQSFNLFPHLTVRDNIILAPKIVKRDKSAKELDELADELLSKVDLLDKKLNYPPQLSGGQQQRIAIARALAMTPQYMLFDEPTSALDPELIGEVLTVIRQLAVEGMSMIIVTHEMNFARDISSKVVMMDEGVIIEEGPPSMVFTKPSNERTKTFLRTILKRD